MNPAVFRWLLIGSASVCVSGILVGAYSSILGASHRHGKLRLAAYLLVGFGTCICAASFIIFQSRLPTYSVNGSIESVSVHPEGRGGYRSNIQLRAESGEELHLNASGRSTYFHPGQLVRLTYQGQSGSILKAEFISPTGQKEGVFNGTDTWPPYFFFVLGLFIGWAGIRKHRRDPEAFEA